jgi:hypothetical protein
MSDYQSLPQAAKPQQKQKQQNLKDPFYTLKQKMQVEVASLQAAFDTWKDFLANTNTATNPVTYVCYSLSSKHICCFSP